MKIWVKRKWFGRLEIKDVKTFDIMMTMDIEGEKIPVTPRFVCKHTDGSFSVTPVENLLDSEWGVTPCRQEATEHSNSAR